MINNSNITKKSTDPKSKKDNKNDTSDSTKNTKKASSIDSLASKATANLAVSTIDKTADSKSKKDNKNDTSDSTENKSNNMLPLKLDDLKKDKKDNKDKEQLSYYEKQVLKELKGIKKASKNILKTLRKFNS
jgi:hypothetical protein